MRLEQANNIVREAIGAVQGDGVTILGLLPIEEPMQITIMGTVQEGARGRWQLLNATLMGPHRAAAAYAIAMARASFQDQGTWQAIQEFLGVGIPQTHRAGLSENFIRVCKNLHLDDGRIGELPNEAPILYQAGILKHWVEHLCTGIRRTLDEMPAANPDDEEYLARFCRRIGSRIHPAQTRLIDCLGNTEKLPKPLGILIIKKLLKARLLGLEQQLPPHLMEPIMEAMATVSRRRQINPPYLHFDPVDSILSIVLPKQNPELLTSESHWELAGKTMNPRREHRWNVVDIRKRSISVSLKNLAGNLRADPFPIETEIGVGTPFRTFDARTGRDLKIRTNHQNPIFLPPGDYHILSDSALPLEGLDVIETIYIGDSSINRLEVELRHNEPPREFSIGGVVRTINVKQDPGLFLYGQSSLEDLSEPLPKKIHCGSGLTLMAVMAAQPDEDFQPLLTLSAEGEANCSYQIPRAIFDAGFDSFASAMSSHLGEFLKELPSGIFNITARIDLSASAFPACKFWYWKGLRRISETEGFVCTEIPVNIQRNRLEGLEIAGTNIGWKAAHRGTEARIHMAVSGDTFLFRKPGIHLQIQDDAHTEHIALGETILISHDDRRDLLIKSSGYDSWTISSDNTPVTTLDGRKKDCAIRILTAAGESRHITAMRLGAANPTPLVTLVRPNEATGLVITRPITPEPHYHAEFRVAQGIVSLGVSEADLMNQVLPDNGDVIDIPLPDNESAASSDLPSGIRITVHREDNEAFKVIVEAALSVLSEKLLMLDFNYRKREGGKWFELQFAESVASSPMRLAVAPLRYEIAGPDLWKRLVAHADRAGSAQTQALIAQLELISDDDLRNYLEILQSVLSFKYPEPVWNDALRREESSWPEQALQILGKAKFAPLDGSRAIWASAVVIEADRRSAARYAPLIVGSLFSAQPGLYAQPSGKFDSDGLSFVARSFHCASIVGSAGALGAFFHSPEGRYVWGQYTAQFQNIVGMQGNPDHAPGNFDFNGYFREIDRGIVSNEGYGADPSTEELLSPGHFAAAARQLNQRIARFEMIARQDNGNHPLARLLRSIIAIHQAFEILQGECLSSLRYPHGFFDGPQRDHVTGMGARFPGVEGQWGNRVVQIVMLLTGMSRLTGYGLKDANWLNPRLKQLLNPGNTHGGLEQGMRVIHSLAPEFISYFHLFWTLTLKDQH